ncbi:MAG: multidrug resistance protein [Gemmatimonadetes bacterium]|nr:multidrug resistance protein [Gemmatimonadota bacterium]
MNRKLIVLMITAFVDMLGLLMVIPLLPFYAKSLGASGLQVGLLMSSFSIAQLVSAPMWGRFSDTYGRRPALIVGLSASAIAFVVFAYAGQLWLLFLSRLVQGAGGGTVSVIQAYVADATRPEDRAKSLGWLSAATNAGVALGPLIGMVSLAGRGAATPGLVAAGLCVINIIFAWIFLHESRDFADAKANPRVRGRSREAVLRVISHPAEPASRLIWIYAVAMGAFTGVNAVLALFLAQRFGVTKHTIGFFFTYVGVISVITRAGFLGRAVDKYGEARLSRVGLVLLGIGLGALPFLYPIADPQAVAHALGDVLPPRGVALLPFLPLAIFVAFIPLGTAFTFPCVTAMLSRVTPSHERGLYMGVQQTFGGAARVAFPTLAGWLFDRSTHAPFVVSALLVLGTIYLGLDMEKYAARPVQGG